MMTTQAKPRVENFSIEMSAPAMSRGAKPAGGRGTTRERSSS
jgi:hypothetical protein